MPARDVAGGHRPRRLCAGQRRAQQTAPSTRGAGFRSVVRGGGQPRRRTSTSSASPPVRRTLSSSSEASWSIASDSCRPLRRTTGSGEASAASRSLRRGEADVPARGRVHVPEVEALGVLPEVDTCLDHVRREGVEDPGQHGGVGVVHAVCPPGVGQGLELEGEGSAAGQRRVDLGEPRQGRGEQGEPGQRLQRGRGPDPQVDRHHVPRSTALSVTADRYTASTTSG